MVKRDNGVLLNDAISLHSGLCMYLQVLEEAMPSSYFVDRCPK